MWDLRVAVEGRVLMLHISLKLDMDLHPVTSQWDSSSCSLTAWKQCTAQSFKPIHQESNQSAYNGAFMGTYISKWPSLGWIKWSHRELSVSLRRMGMIFKHVDIQNTFCLNHCWKSLLITHFIVSSIVHLQSGKHTYIK